MKRGDSWVDEFLIGECWAREIAGIRELWSGDGGSDIMVGEGLWLGGAWSRGSTTRGKHD